MCKGGKARNTHTNTQSIHESTPAIVRASTQNVQVFHLGELAEGLNTSSEPIRTERPESEFRTEFFLDIFTFDQQKQLR